MDANRWHIQYSAIKYEYKYSINEYIPKLLDRNELLQNIILQILNSNDKILNSNKKKKKTIDMTSF